MAFFACLGFRRCVSQTSARACFFGRPCFGPWVVEEQLLRPGTMRRNWKNTLLSDGHIMVRHPDWDEAHRMSFAAATDITMYAGG